MHRPGIPSFLALAVLGGAGCTAKEPATARPDSTATVPAPAVAAGPNVVTVHTSDFKFDVPDTIAAGMTTFRLVNDGPHLHHMQIMRLDSAKTYADFQRAIMKKGPPPRWVVLVGGPNAAEPKTESNATQDMPAGNYVIACFVDMPGGVPHVARGMAKALTVAPSTAAAVAAPTADVTMTLADYSFTLSRPLAAGKQMIEVRNSGPQPHEVELIKLAPGKTSKDLMAWMQKRNGPPPGSAIGGVAGAVPGSSLFFSADVTPGDYVLVCFLPDAKDGKPHFMKGMMQDVKIS